MRHRDENNNSLMADNFVKSPPAMRRDSTSSNHSHKSRDRNSDRSRHSDGMLAECQIYTMVRVIKEFF